MPVSVSELTTGSFDQRFTGESKSTLYSRASIPIYRWRQMRQGHFFGGLLKV